MMPYVRHRRGLGATGSQIVGTAGRFASPVVTAAAAPATAAALGISASLAVPLVGAAFAGILFGVEALMNSGCGQACIVTSQWADQAEALLKQNIQQYFAIPAPRTDLDKHSALNIFDAIWAGLMQRCSQPGLSTAGRNCIADRQSGACKWKQTADSLLLQYPGEPQPGSCWDWFSGYRAPIANDPTVASTSAVGITSAISSAASSLNISPLWLLVGLGVAAWAVAS